MTNNHMLYCNVDGCNNKHGSKGYCKLHYTRWKRHGNPLIVIKIMDPSRGCKINNCDSKHYGKGLCKKHHQKSRYHPTIYKLTIPPIKCTVKGCKETRRGKGLCKKHYRKKYNTDNKDEIKRKRRNYRKNNADKIKNTNDKWCENNPDKVLQYQITHLEKIGKLFDMNSMEFKYALRSWSKVVKKLDNKICKNCSSAKNLHAHHIQPKNDFPKLSLDLNNGITLCNNCHEKIHGFKTYC